MDMIPDAAADVDRLTELALALSPAARELVAYRIWESLQPSESWPLSREQMEEIQRRVGQTENGKTVDGDAVLREARVRIEARRR
jgi:hypothetical protein